MLSILVPVYNTAPYLSRCIDSILTQTYSDFELVLVDDGSTDVSGRICDAYADKDWRIIVIHKKNGGLGSARIAGLEHAKGECVAFVDSDDYIEGDMYEKLIAPLQNDSTIDISVGGYVMETSTRILSCHFVAEEQKIFPASRAISEMFANRIFNWSLCDKIYRRDLFNFDLQDWPNFYGEDTFVNWKLFHQAQRVAYQPLYAYHYCMRHDSMTQQPFSKKYLSYLDIYDRILEDSQGKPYAVDVIRIMMDGGARYIFEMQKDWAHYESEIEHYRILLNKHIARYNYHMNLSEQWRMDLINRNKKEHFVSIQRQKNELRGFANRFPHLFIYGAGIIANEVAGEMERYGNVYDGFVVSERSTENSFFHGKPVISINQLKFPANTVGFILAMNRCNEVVVRELLESMGYSNLYFAGKESYFYV